MCYRVYTIIFSFIAVVYCVEIKPYNDSEKAKINIAWEGFQKDSILSFVFKVPDSVTLRFFNGEVVAPKCSDTLFKLSGQTYRYFYMIGDSNYCVLKRGDRFLMLNIEVYTSDSAEVIRKKLLKMGFSIKDGTEYYKKSIMISHRKHLVKIETSCPIQIEPPFHVWSIVPYLKNPSQRENGHK